MGGIIVIDYDPNWPATFARLRERIWPVVSDVATSVEHVGSTSIPGLAAKPIIDISLVVPTASDVPMAIERLAALDYIHRGNLGVEGRDTFQSPGTLPRHHLYLCPRDSLALRNHLLVRDYLRAHPEVAARYGELKKELARQHPDEIDAYVAGKTDLLLEILGASGLSAGELDAIARINRRA